MDIFNKININKTRFSNKVLRTKILFCDFVKHKDIAELYYVRIARQLQTTKNNLYAAYHNLDYIDGERLIGIVRENCIMKFNYGLDNPSTRSIDLLTTKHRKETEIRLLYICNQISIHLNNIHR